MYQNGEATSASLLRETSLLITSLLRVMTVEHIIYCHDRNKRTIMMDGSGELKNKCSCPDIDLVEDDGLIVMKGSVVHSEMD